MSFWLFIVFVSVADFLNCDKLFQSKTNDCDKFFHLAVFKFGLINAEDKSNEKF